MEGHVFRRWCPGPDGISGTPAGFEGVAIQGEKPRASTMPAQVRGARFA